jgi:hypothetical protein
VWKFFDMGALYKERPAVVLDIHKEVVASYAKLL